jgi:hypothetical protein
VIEPSAVHCGDDRVNVAQVREDALKAGKLLGEEDSPGLRGEAIDDGLVQSAHILD